MEDWTEKYRPDRLKDIVGNRKAVEQLRRWGESWLKDIPDKRAVILSGKPGIGKTSSAHALGREYSWTIIELNASDTRNSKIIKSIATTGATYETFTDNGDFKQGSKKLIILDEADNLYESGRGKEYSDKGGKKAIIDTIKITKQPIILIANDIYQLLKGSGEQLKQLCHHIQFYPPYPSEIQRHLIRICQMEGKKVDGKLLQTISIQCNGDLRSAIRDLQAICTGVDRVELDIVDILGERDRSKTIFDLLQKIFLTKDIEIIKKHISLIDEDPNSMILWIDENIPRVYSNPEDLTAGYEEISKADIFLGRVYSRNNYTFWSYASDLMSIGVSISKKHSNRVSRYMFPQWLINLKQGKNYRNIKNQIIDKLSLYTHSSKKKTSQYIYPYFQFLCKKDVSFLEKMMKELDLNEEEIIFLVGKRKNMNKIKKNDIKIEDMERKTNLQQKLL